MSSMKFPKTNNYCILPAFGIWFIVVILQALGTSAEEAVGSFGDVGNIQKLDGAGGTSQNSDYEDYSEDEESPSSIKLGTPDPRSTALPYFKSNFNTIYIKGEQKVVFTCPVINYDESRHLIMWYKDEQPITNGKEPLRDAYQVDNKFNLIIKDFSKETPGNYSCSVMPHNVRQYIIVKAQPNNAAAAGDNLDSTEKTHEKQELASANRQAAVHASLLTVLAMWSVQSVWALR